MADINVPTQTELMWPTLKAIKALGGSARNNEILSKVIELEGYSEELQADMMPNGSQTRLEYRLGWARTQLKNIEAILNAQLGVWTITDHGEALSEATMLKEFQEVDAAYYALRAAQANFSGPDDTDTTDIIDDADWQTKLLGVLKTMDPSAFERLSQLLLRAAGFKSVSVTGRTGDGGIDGHGILQVNLITFSVGFQCKRYKGLVGPEVVREFIGAILNEYERGLLITTGHFGPGALKEAERSAAQTLDLIDGIRLCELLAQYGLGVTTKTVPEYTVDAAWFDSI